MDYQNEMNAKMAAAQEYLAKDRAQGIAGTCGQAQKQSYYGDTCATQEARPSMRSQAEMDARVHQEQAEKHCRAAKFFHENPAFDEFIQLVRSGAIQF